MVERNDLLIGLLLGLGEEHFYSAKLPSRMTIKKFKEDEKDLKNLYVGMFEAFSLSFIFSLLICLLMKSWRAFIIALLINIFILITYLDDIEIIDLKLDDFGEWLYAKAKK